MFGTLIGAAAALVLTTVAASTCTDGLHFGEEGWVDDVDPVECCGHRGPVWTRLDGSDVIGFRWGATLYAIREDAGDKLLTLTASALAGGECIDDAAALRAGGTAGVLGCTVKAPSTLGTFLRSFRWGHVRQLDRVTRKLLRAPGTMATRACAAITRCSPLRPGRVTC